MADEKEKTPEQIAREQELKNQIGTLSNKSSSMIYGVDNRLGDQSDQMRDVIRQTMNATSGKYGNRANGQVVNYFNELNFSKAFMELVSDPAKKKEIKENPDKAFKRYMASKDVGDISSLLSAESSRMVAYNNYRAIYNHIPEAAQALDTFKDNIMSPDDFTKLIFTTEYANGLDSNLKEKVEIQLEDIIDKYEMEELADEIIEGSLMYGDQYIAVLSIEKELDYMLSDPMYSGEMLTEDSLAMFDADKVDVELNKTDIPVDSDLLEAFADGWSLNKEQKEQIKKENLQNFIADIVNEKIKIGSKKELLMERLSAEKSSSLNEFLDGAKDKKRGRGRPRKNDSQDNKPMYINGSTLNVLDPSKVVELKIDNTVYGYYYAQDIDQSNIPNAGYLGQSTGREVLNPVNMGSNLITTNNSKFTPSTNNFSLQGLSDGKINLISRIFIDTISKKVNKDFVRHNKQFKDFIFNLIKQDYIIRKDIKLIFFNPDEVVAFKVPALYRKIVFFAKLYMAMLTNMLLVKMGRAHDKRIFYVDVGVDANYEQAISRVIQDIKTKEFKMDSIGDINTILNLNPGMFDNYYIPTVNGERPIEIDTLQGMDIDMNNEFLEFLKTSMMSGMGIPRTLIDETIQTDFARTLSARNANFVRSVIKYQKKLTPSFNKLIRRLYENEYKYSNDGESDILTVVKIKDIHVNFPSPATLNMTNITDQIQVAESNADFISNNLIEPDPTGQNDVSRAKLKAKIVEDLIPAINWEKYRGFKKEILIEEAGEKASNKKSSEEDVSGLF
jgi:hypothetical protein